MALSEKRNVSHESTPMQRADEIGRPRGPRVVQRIACRRAGDRRADKATPRRDVAAHGGMQSLPLSRPATPAFFQACQLPGMLRTSLKPCALQHARGDARPVAAVAVDGDRLSLCPVRRASSAARAGRDAARRECVLLSILGRAHVDDLQHPWRSLTSCTVICGDFLEREAGVVPGLHAADQVAGELRVAGAEEQRDDLFHLRRRSRAPAGSARSGSSSQPAQIESSASRRCSARRRCDRRQRRASSAYPPDTPSLLLDRLLELLRRQRRDARADCQAPPGPSALTFFMRV